MLSPMGREWGVKAKGEDAWGRFQELMFGEQGPSFCIPGSGVGFSPLQEGRARGAWLAVDRDNRRVSLPHVAASPWPGLPQDMAASAVSFGGLTVRSAGSSGAIPITPTRGPPKAPPGL